MSDSGVIGATAGAINSAGGDLGRAGLMPQLSRYTLASVVALLLDCTVYLGLASGLGMRAALAGIAGYLCGLVLHFLISSRFVFRGEQTGKSPWRLFAEFAITGVMGLAITAGIIGLATEAGGVPLVFAKALAIVLSFLAVFVVRRRLVFASLSAQG